MPWVSLFEVFPNAVVQDHNGNILPVLNGRVEFQFPDIESGGGAAVSIELAQEDASNLRVALTDIIASPVGTNGLYQSYAGLSSEEAADNHDNVHGMARLEFAEVLNWQYINLETYRPGV